MGIVVSFSVGDLLKSLSKEETADIANGGLDGSEVWYRYKTMLDDKVRPSHAALENTLWRADDPDAPTPPLAEGCRCFIEYCAAPDSIASGVLPEADGPLSNRNQSFSNWLDVNVDDWKSIAKTARSYTSVNRLQAIIDDLLDAGYDSGKARDIGYMILSIL